MERSLPPVRSEGMRRAFALGLLGLGAITAVGFRALSYPRLPAPAQIAVERAATPPGMVYVPAGEAILGTDDPDAEEDARPARRAFLPAFYIDRNEVTNAEFARFKPTHVFPKGEERLPATGILYDEAVAYARWAGKRLPTDAEWEKAARGTDGRLYPWGNTYDRTRVAARAKRPTKLPCGGYSRVQPIGSAPKGASPYGCLDLAGNAWEWVSDLYQNDPEKRILRGGAAGYGERANRTYSRGVEGAGVT
jgi:formylglycine-generating enzyme required for sulfatase activity